MGAFFFVRSLLTFVNNDAPFAGNTNGWILTAFFFFDAWLLGECNSLGQSSPGLGWQLALQMVQIAFTTAVQQGPHGVLLPACGGTWCCLQVLNSAPAHSSTALLLEHLLASFPLVVRLQAGPCMLLHVSSSIQPCVPAVDTALQHISCASCKSLRVH
jgi:hypothetical protein